MIKNMRGEIDMMGRGYGISGGWFGMMLIPLTIIGVIIYAAVKLSNNNNHGGNQRQYDKSIEVLNERFAKGEITEEEYSRKKEMLLRR